MSPSSADAGSSDDGGSEALFNVAIATIFAREFLEGAIIIGQYRTVIKKSNDFSGDRETEALKTVTKAAWYATAVAVLVVLAVAIPLAILSRDLDPKTAEIIEGISKVVAAVCILQLSLKIPVWLNLYAKIPIFGIKKKIIAYFKGPQEEKKKTVKGLTFNEIRFNVAWNIWREVAECGIFLIPFFLGTGAEAIPISALVGTAIALVLGIGIYYSNQKMEDKRYLSFFMSGLTMMLAVGLFVGGCHEFEEVWGMTKNVWKIDNDFWYHKNFPMVILKPFGYSASRSVLQITTFWCFVGLGLFLHYMKWRNTSLARERGEFPVPESNEEEEEEVDVDVEKDAVIQDTEDSE